MGETEKRRKEEEEEREEEERFGMKEPRSGRGGGPTWRRCG